MAEAESNLRAKKEQSMMLWGKVAYLESEVKNKFAEMVRKRSKRRVDRRKLQNKRSWILVDGKNREKTQRFMTERSWKRRSKRCSPRIV